MKDPMTLYMILVTPENATPYFMKNYNGSVHFTTKGNAKLCLNCHLKRVRAEQAKVEIVEYHLSGGEVKAMWYFGPNVTMG